jgi:hypothetical protein
LARKTGGKLKALTSQSQIKFSSSVYTGLTIQRNPGVPNIVVKISAMIAWGEFSNG